MKNYYSYVISAMVWALLALGCHPGEKYLRHFTLENGTNHEIELRFYRYGRQTFMRDNVLSSKGDIFTRSAWFSPRYGSDPLLYDAFQVPDSLIIIFDDSRIAITKRPLPKLDDDSTTVLGKTDTVLIGIDKYLFSDEAYTIESKESYRYIFTEQDYENAEEITSGE